MDVSESSTSSYNQPIHSNILAKTLTLKSSGLTLVLPPLKGGKPVIGGKKSKHWISSHPSNGLQDEEKKPPRPVKLKPLKDVLTKLIAQIKKKDDYAFFLKPVDTSKIQGYLDVVKRPMDFGTMSVKVAKGKYRSLEDFASDLRLVTSNAKIFNPPGTIYHTEADRIEAWALEHISKASSTVIQYETDWNIDVEKDDDDPTVNVDDDDDYNIGTPMDTDDAGLGRRSASVVSQVLPGTSRRGVRGSHKKLAPTNTLSESIDGEGRLPGSKDGLGTFPPGSDWAHTMLALKLKGKRYKTKKERLRVEKEGPPLLADGSLDYTEMEDPFSVLSVFAPEPFSRPYVIPLHPSMFTPSSLHPNHDPSLSQPSRSSAPFPTSINLPIDHPLPQLPPSITTTDPSIPAQRRHWVITRNPTRAKGKERDDEYEAPDQSTWQTPREIHAVDYGSFAILAGALEDEMRRRGVPGKEGEEEERVFEVIRNSLHCEGSGSENLSESAISDTGLRIDDYWSTQRANIAEGYIRDIVYGGVDGLAYVRSLAEFVTTEGQTNSTPCPGLGGVSLAKWVEREVVDTLTEGRHASLRETAVELAKQARNPPRSPVHEQEDYKQPKNLHDQVQDTLYVYPRVAVALAALLQIKTHQIDMGSLIKTPNELFESEEEWAGKALRERRKAHTQETVKKEESPRSVELETEEAERTWMDVDVSAQAARGQGGEYELESPEELNEVMDHVANVIVRLNKQLKDSNSTSDLGVATNMPTLYGDAGEGGIEDPILRNLRLNLLALAKRAPLDTIARLPKDLVPEHIRQFIPTLNTTS